MSLKNLIATAEEISWHKAELARRRAEIQARARARARRRELREEEISSAVQIAFEHSGRGRIGRGFHYQLRRLGYKIVRI